MPSVPGQRKAGKHDNLPVSASKVDTLIPERIAESPERMEIWNFLVTDLRERGLWSPTYTLLVEQCIENYDLMVKARQHIDRQGAVVEKYNHKGESVGTRQNPWVSVLRGCESLFMKTIEKLGMSPRDIVFLSQVDPNGDDVLEAEATERPKVVYFR